MQTVASNTTKHKSRALTILLGLFGAVLAFYLGFAAWLRIDGRFAFRTTLNGRDVSLQRALDVQRTCMDGYYRNMSFSLECRDNPPYSVTPQSFDFSGASRAVEFLPKHTLAWPVSLLRDTAYNTSDGNAIKKLTQRIEHDCAAFQSDRWKTAENAYLAYDGSSGEFVVIPDTPGTTIDTELFEKRLDRHIRYGSGDLDLSAAGLYRPAAVRVYSVELHETSEALERFLAATVVFSESGVTKVFEARTLAPYLTVDRETLSIRCDTAAADADGVFDAFAAQLAEALDSPGTERDFITHDGTVVTVAERTWREKFDANATARALAALTFDDYAASDGPLEGTLVWERAALDALTNYVEVDLSSQMLYLYTNGALVLETPIVSGNVAQRHTTPAGAFSLIGKYRNVTLRGPGYASFVRYWMPFNNKIGLHDASWRSNFGGTIYRTNGSHGCVNLPRDVAEIIYNTIDASYAVVCYWRPTETSPATGSAAAPAACASRIPPLSTQPLPL